MVSDAALSGLTAGIPALAEIALFSWTVFILCRRAAFPFAEAAVYALAAPLMALSIIFQTALILDLPIIAPAAEMLLMLICAAALFRTRSSGELLRVFVSVLKDHRLAFVVLSVFFTCVAVRAMIIEPTASQLAWLSPDQGFYSMDVLIAWLHNPDEPTPAVINHRILLHLFLRFETVQWLGIFNFMAYLIIGFSTYSLARRYSWPQTAMTSAMIVLSSPRLVYLAMATGSGFNELLPAAFGVFSLLALYRTIEQPVFQDLVMLGSAIAFTVSSQPLGMVFPSILAGLSCVVLFRRHGGRFWRRLITEGNSTRYLAILPLIVFSQIWLAPLIQWRHPDGKEIPATAEYASNVDGLVGGFANMIRYGLKSMDPAFGNEGQTVKEPALEVDRMVQGIYDNLVVPIVGDRGANTPVDFQHDQTPPGWWFGPLGFLLVAPAVLFSMFRGPRRLKAVAVAMAGYFYLASLLPAWKQGNECLMTVLFVCSGYMTAFFLPPWRFTRLARLCLQTLCTGLLVYSAILVLS